MTAKPLNNPMESQGVMGVGELQFNIGASDMDYRVSPPRYTEQQSISEPRVETSEKEREVNARRSVTFADPMSTVIYSREILVRHQERRGTAMDSRGAKVRRCVGSLMP
jgi:hypothetical protein